MCMRICRLSALVTMFVFSMTALTALSADANVNQVPNFGFVGTDGAHLGDANGDIPSHWRAYGVGGGDISLEIVPLASNALYPGSPATNAVKVTINTFGSDQGFDHEQTPFSLAAGHDYTATLYMRSANTGGADQGVSVAFPLFDVNGFTGRAPGSFVATVDDTWKPYTGPSFQEDGSTVGNIAFRLQNDGGENSIIIAIPSVDGPANSGPELTYPPVYTQGRSFAPTDRFVSTILFHWYTKFTGQQIGPWKPTEGRINWTGEESFWRDQIKDIMDANIDVINVHLFTGFEWQREQFFKALHQLRREGYDTPYVLPFLDPLIIWNNNPIDMTLESSKDEYVDHYRRWFDQYFLYDQGEYAESRLLHIDDRIGLNTWHNNPGSVDNMSALTRDDVESRLKAKFADQYPSFNQGIYQFGTANGVAPAYADEITHQFSNTEYFTFKDFNGKRSATMKAGYWDQNIRNPGSFLPRNGGGNFADAWQDLLAARDGNNGLPIYHAFVESWNEYDEGTGIYSGVVDDPYIAPANGSGNTDTWSLDNNPREYIDSTWKGASAFNDNPDLDSQFLWHDFPASMAPGESRTVQVLVRNTGDLKWSSSAGFTMEQSDTDSHTWGPASFTIADGPNEVAKYGGVFRGRPVLFEFTITAPNQPGVYQAQYRMQSSDGGEVVFGDTLAVQVTVGTGQVEAGHSGPFYNPTRNGEGNYVEILSDTTAVIYTFTYRPDGTGPAWFIGVGDITGDTILINDLLRPKGAKFGPDFDKTAVEYTPVGNMSMSFLDCKSQDNEGSVTYSGKPSLGYEQLLSRAVRLGQITGCGEAVAENSGLSGSFYDAVRDGEGIVVEWLNSGQVVVVFFTYDPQGNQFWTLGIGDSSGKSVTIEAIYPSSWTRWGSAFNPDDVVLSPWGTFTLTWTGCDSVTFEYDSVVPGFGAATRNYTRISKFLGTSCPAFP
ncbi:MAG: NBR1-Ig-like domain-containing protein [Lysobacterales bacterium]